MELWIVEIMKPLKFLIFELTKVWAAFDVGFNEQTPEPLTWLSVVPRESRSVGLVGECFVLIVASSISALIELRQTTNKKKQRIRRDKSSIDVVSERSAARGAAKDLSLFLLLSVISPFHGPQRAHRITRLLFALSLAGSFSAANDTALSFRRGRRWDGRTPIDAA